VFYNVVYQYAESQIALSPSQSSSSRLDIFDDVRVFIDVLAFHALHYTLVLKCSGKVRWFKTKFDQLNSGFDPDFGVNFSFNPEISK